jgi:WD40 repeat protein
MRHLLWIVLCIMLLTGVTLAQDDAPVPIITAENIATLVEIVLPLDNAEIRDVGWAADGDVLLVLTDTAVLAYGHPITAESAPLTLIDDLNAVGLEIAAPAADNPDGFSLVTINSGANAARMWQISADLSVLGDAQDITNSAGLYSTDVDPVNDTFVSGSNIEGLLRYWLPNTDSGTQSGQTLSAPLVEAFGFDRDGDLLAIGNTDGVVTIDELVDGAPTGTGQVFFGHLERITAVAFSPPVDDPDVVLLLASGDWGGVVHIWEVTFTEVIFEPLLILNEGHINVVESLGWTVDASVLVSLGADDVVRFWDMRDPTVISLLYTWRDADDITPRVAFSPDGTQLAIGYSMGDNGGGVTVLSTPEAE